MKQLFLLLAAFVSCAVQAQDTKSAQKILIGYNFSPDYNFRSLKNSDGSPASNLVIKSREDREIAKFGYTTGLNICFNFSQIAGFETGIQFTNKGYKTKKQDLVYLPPSPASPTKASFSHSYQYLGIPLKVRFAFGKGKVRFTSGIGIMAGFLLNVNNTTHNEYADGRTEKKNRISNIRL